MLNFMSQISESEWFIPAEAVDENLVGDLRGGCFKEEPKMVVHLSENFLKDKLSLVRLIVVAASHQAHNCVFAHIALHFLGLTEDMVDLLCGEWPVLALQVDCEELAKVSNLFHLMGVTIWDDRLVKAEAHEQKNDHIGVRVLVPVHHKWVLELSVLQMALFLSLLHYSSRLIHKLLQVVMLLLCWKRLLLKTMLAINLLQVLSADASELCLSLLRHCPLVVMVPSKQLNNCLATEWRHFTY